MGGHDWMLCLPMPFARRHWFALVWLTSLLVQAAPAPWYHWRSLVDGSRVCAQTSPGQGWERDSAAFDGPGCQPRSKVIVVPMR
jgi:hypothetical protein